MRIYAGSALIGIDYRSKRSCIRARDAVLSIFQNIFGQLQYKGAPVTHFQNPLVAEN